MGIFSWLSAELQCTHWIAFDSYLGMSYTIPPPTSQNNTNQLINVTHCRAWLLSVCMCLLTPPRLKWSLLLRDVFFFCPVWSATVEWAVVGRGEFSWPRGHAETMVVRLLWEEQKTEASVLMAPVLMAPVVGGALDLVGHFGKNKPKCSCMGGGGCFKYRF